MKLLEEMARHDYEQVVFYLDRAVGLRAIIAIHDTTLGPALGGVRMRPYASEEEALRDVLRLARAMTYKAAAAGLDLGGGKAVIIGDPVKDKSEALFRAYGRFVHSLGGRYLTTEDVGTTETDMIHISKETTFVTGLPISLGGSGDPSPATAYGIFQGMKACAREVFGSPSLQGRTVALQGCGKVGYHLARHLHEEGAHLLATDIEATAARRVRNEFHAVLVEPEAICDAECDIFSPCALGAVLNDQTIPRLRCQVVAGAANNQLAEERHAQALADRGILYAPDYILNAGGIINLSFEFNHYNAEAAYQKVGGIYQTLEQVISLAKREKFTTAQAADRLVEERLAAVRQIRGIYLRS